MRVLIFPLGSAGDVHPFLGVGAALAARGHDVIVATSGYFEPVVRKTGLQFASLGTAQDFEKVTQDPNLWHPKKAFETVVRKGIEPGYARTLEIAREFHQPGNTVIVGSTLAIGGRTAAEIVGAPFVTVHLAPSIFFSIDKPPLFAGMWWGPRVPRFATRFQFWVAKRLTDGIVLPGLNKFRAAHGLAPASDVVRQWWHSPRRVIGLFPAWFGPPQRDWPPQVRLTGFPMFDEQGHREPPEGLEEFLRAGDAPVIFTPGSAMAHGQDFFRQSVRACTLLGRRAILLSQFPETIPRDLPPSVRHFRYIPFSEVFPRAAALVSHGGIGTTAQALRAGIPHLVQHMAHDQLDNAQRLVELGVGESLAAAKYRAPAVAEKLGRLLKDPAVKQRSAELAARFEPEKWMAQTCDLIVEAGQQAGP